MSFRSPIAGSRVRLWVQRLVLLLVALLVIRGWYLEGLRGRLTVVSGSMAETLLGVHREVTCGDCRHRFVCGADLQPVSSRAVCPNCGYAGNDLGAEPNLAGDGVLIDKTVYRFRRPRRWEVVAFRHPDQASRTCVKRVVGLPGELIQIRHGDVYVDGAIRRKTLRQQRALAVGVHDANYRPGIDPVVAARWQGSPGSRWISDGGRFAHPGISNEGAAEDWLEYCHWQRVAGEGEQVREGPVTDVCGYNQTRPRRQEEVRPVGDLLLSLRLERTSGRGRLVIRASDGREEFRVRIDPNRGRWEVLRDRLAVQGASGELAGPTEGTTVEVSLFDRQFLLAFDGRPVVRIRNDSPQPQRPSSRPLAIASQGGLELVIGDLRVYRDVYYTHPIGLRGRWGLDEPVRLAAEQYFVLGDNSPISDDSRSWPGGPALDAKLLVGKPLVVHFPARLVELGGWRFQVPDPGRIRYIR